MVFQKSHRRNKLSVYSTGRFLEGPENMVNVRLDWDISMEASWHIPKFKWNCKRCAVVFYGIYGCAVVLITKEII